MIFKKIRGTDYICAIDSYFPNVSKSYLSGLIREIRNAITCQGPICPKKGDKIEFRYYIIAHRYQSDYNDYVANVLIHVTHKQFVTRLDRTLEKVYNIKFFSTR